ncbi:hypothetical protein [Vibrio sp. ER1A]|uniref:hypothetical protein n=1 Tax=Vibrio sp. ER1A TaxID=1517681 RepID=UPI0004DD0755|nr:hypothetical protein [Vibrio sp. ER1A]KFA98786.1 ABC transporter ATPase [Vibrio sp. ER1A]
MPYVPFTNTQAEALNVGGRTILPGETREVDARFVPAPSMVNRDVVVLFINFNEEPRFFGTTKVEAGKAARLPLIHFENPNVEESGKVQLEIFKQLLEKNISEITPYVSELNDDELSLLVDLEGLGEKRKTLLKHFADELAVRTAERSFDPEAFAASLKGMDDGDLNLALLDAGDNEMKITAIENELSERKASKEQ